MRYSLQHIWDEVGESDSERDKMLLQLEQECLEVYRRKVDNASQNRARLHQMLASAEGEFAALFSALGEPTLSLRVSFLIRSRGFWIRSRENCNASMVSGTKY